MANLLLSVVVPTHNRCQALMHCLDSLAVQNLAPERFEVIVVADACNDDTEAMVKKYVARMPYQLRITSHTARSAAATRNLGAGAAHGEIIVFLDDDMVATPSLLNAHLEGLQDADVSIGYSRPSVPSRPSQWQTDARRWWEDRFREMATTSHRFRYLDLFSGNLAMRAELFRCVGGFDLTFAGRLEDYELGVRLIKAGAQLHFSRNALAAHHDGSDFDTWLRRVRHDGEAEVLLVMRHPELLSALFGHAQFPTNSVTSLIRLMACAWPAQGEGAVRSVVKLIRFCEVLTMRRTRERLLVLVREYNYWRGVSAAAGGSRKLQAFLAKAQPLTLAEDAPEIDLAALPAAAELERLLALASVRGLRVFVGGAEATQILPQPAAEPLRLAHIVHALRQSADRQIVPGVALQMIGKEDLSCWPTL